MEEENVELMDDSIPNFYCENCSAVYEVTWVDDGPIRKAIYCPFCGWVGDPAQQLGPYEQAEAFIKEQREMWMRKNLAAQGESGYLKGHTGIGTAYEEAWTSAEVVRELDWILHRLFGHFSGVYYRNCDCASCRSHNWG